MSSAYNKILKTILLLCCFCYLVCSDSRDSFASRLHSSKSFGCSRTGNASVSFLNNVNLLLSNFNLQSSTSSYYNSSTGDSSDRVYGYYMCRADVSLQVCNCCMINGTQFSSVANCDQVDGFFFSEMCNFRYSNHCMYGQWESTLSVTDRLEVNVSNNQQFNQILSSTLENLINKAAFESQNNGSTLGFATMEANVTRDETIYSLAQCTPDIVGVNCSRCLRSGLSYFRDSSNVAPAAYAILKKCYLRYNNVSFYNLEDLNASTGMSIRSSKLLSVYSAMFLSLYYNLCFFRP